MSEPQTAPRSRQKFYAFSAVGAAMVCVPLVQVLQYQHSDLRQLQAERSLLDPVSHAVNAQYSLLAHGDLAAHTLVGRELFEADRQRVALDVDTQIHALIVEIEQGAWSDAREEARSLAADWTVLADRVNRRGIGVPQSRQAHELRVEQVLQILDLVAMNPVSESPRTGAHGTEADGRPSALLSSARVLLRMAQETAALGQAAGPPEQAGGWVPGAVHDLQPARQRALTRLQAVEQALPAPQRAALANAFADARAATLAHLDGLADTRPEAAQLPRSAQAALQAQQTLFVGLGEQQRKVLALRSAQAERKILAWLLLMVAMLGLATTLALRLLRELPAAVPVPGTATDPEPGSGPGSAQPPSSSRTETGRVMRRLRHGPEPGPAQAEAKASPASPAQQDEPATPPQT